MGLVDSWRLTRLLTTRDRSSAGPDAGIVSMRPRRLGGASVVLRRGTSDARVAKDTLVHAYHRPATGLEPQVVWDLGSNIGLTVADYACLYPRARIVGVEADTGNAALAARNVRAWSDRCRIVNCAVWHEDGEVALEVEPGEEWSARILDADPGASHTVLVKAVSLTTLLEEEQIVDFLKMDIEGAEAAVLRRNTGWAEKVRCITVEVHPPYTTDLCIHDLRRLGFTTHLDPRHWASVTGIKR